MAIDIKMASPEAWALDAPGDLFEALSELADRGWRGAVDVHRPRSGDPVWMLKVVEDVEVPQHPPVECRIGERLILSMGVLRRMTAAEFEQVQA